MRHCHFFFALLVCSSVLACQQKVGVARETTAPPQTTEAATAKKESAPESLPQKPVLKLPLKNPRVIVSKSERRLELFADGRVVRSYKVGLGLNPVPDKQRQGDRATPEGEFYVFTKNYKSAFYLSLGVSYPNVEDAERGLREHLISRRQHDAIVRAIKRKATPLQNTALGGDIYIHGNGAGSDWTWGCVALENEDIRELFGAVPVGTPVTIRP
ncbi:MAG TPA: L,D-transpeptidase [Pyrinomonadaceae bacterium]|nr:L,D-transpeptidase [Pyrinomonadaceae bacterium]